MDRGSRPLRTIIIVLGSSWFTLVLSALRVLVLPAKLGDHGLGEVTLAISFTTFFGIFATLGTSTYLVRAVARDEGLLDRYVSNALWLRVVMGGAVLAILIAIARVIGYPPQTLTVILIVGLQMILYTFSNVFESGLQALGQMGWRAIATAIGQSSTTILGIVLLLLGANAVVYALTLPLGMVIQFALVLSYYLRKRPIKLSLDLPVMKLLLIGGMPLFLWGALQTAYGQIDATILSLFASERVVGWFGAATQITSMLILIPGAVIAVALPVLCEMHVRSRQDFERASSRTMLTTLLVMAPLGVGLSLSAHDVFRLLPYPAVFQNAVPALRLMSLALPVTSVLMVLGTMAIAIEQERQWVKISAFAVCIFPPLYVVLIWWFQANTANGATGAALANLIGESALVVWSWFVLPRELRQRALLTRALQVGGLTAGMAALVVVLQRFDVSIFIYVPAAALVYLTGAWLMRLITSSDLDVVLGALRRRGRRVQAPA